MPNVRLPGIAPASRPAGGAIAGTGDVYGYSGVYTAFRRVIRLLEGLYGFQAGYSVAMRLLHGCYMVATQLLQGWVDNPNRCRYIHVSVGVGAGRATKDRP